MIKWTVRKPADMRIPPDQRARFFRECDEVETSGPRGGRKAEAKNGGNLEKTLFEWVEFKPLPIPIPEKPAQRKYGIWVGSYLNSAAPIDFEVFFDWSAGGENLVIYLYPDPSTRFADPPSPPAPPPPETSA